MYFNIYKIIIHFFTTPRRLDRVLSLTYLLI
jgi:hypothetical protein